MLWLFNFAYQEPYLFNPVVNPTAGGGGKNNSGGGSNKTKDRGSKRNNGDGSSISDYAQVIVFSVIGVVVFLFVNILIAGLGDYFCKQRAIKGEFIIRICNSYSRNPHIRTFYC